MKYFFYLLCLLILSNCSQPVHYEWKYEKTIALDSISPVGLIISANGFWISDSDHNRLVKTDFEGNVLEIIDGLERPMHLAFFENTLYIPEYSSDTIRTWKDGKMSFIPLPEAPDAPAGIDVNKNMMAAADFYNGRIIFQVDGQNQTFGKKGSQSGEFNYPTDVQIVGDKIYVADAYNHRVQVFDKNGKVLKIIGEAEKMNASTGIFANEVILIVTDFENNRVLTYTPDGELKNIITKNLEKPVDVAIAGDKLYVANYKGKSIAVFQR